MSPKVSDGIAKSEDPDQTAPSWSALFAQAYLPENLRYCRYAFVVFKTPQVLEKAMAEKKGQKLNRSRVVLEYTEERRQFINKPGRMKCK